MKFENGQNLEDYFRTIDINLFPQKINFISVYDNIVPVLRQHAQDVINQGSQESFTKHISSHFDKVIDVASELLKAKNFELSPYEIFLLLCSIQVHDIGNLLGRLGHEITAEEIYHDLIPEHKFPVGFDSFDERIFLNIAKAHSGSIQGDKDTINHWLPNPIPSYHGENFKQQMLAAILRLADELSESPERALIYLLKKGRIGKESEIHHYYADTLKNTIISIREHKVTLSFMFTIDNAFRKFQKGDQEKYLIDEIFLRNIKLHTESKYCNKFLPAKLQIHKINVEIGIYTERFKKELLSIAYEMFDKGYPSENITEISRLCLDPNKLKSPDGRYWDGAILEEYLKKK